MTAMMMMTILMVQIIMLIVCALFSHTVGPMAFSSGKSPHVVCEITVATALPNKTGSASALMPQYDVSYEI